jgi:hypothetical protein
MKGKKLKIKLPKGVKYNPELDKYSNVVLFPEKVKQANELLKKAPIPKWILEQR